MIMNAEQLNNTIEEHGWLPIPDQITTREGILVNSANEIWHLPYAIISHPSIDFEKIKNLKLRWVTKRHIQDRLETTSTHAGFTAFSLLWAEALTLQDEFNITQDLDHAALKQALISLFEHIIAKSRSNHRLYALYRPIQWYIWCAENYPELGFCLRYSMELEALVIPGGPKGEAVRMEDPDCGPLNRSLELPLLFSKLRDDNSNEFEHLQQKAALALSIAFGRNPANLTYLRESDFKNLTPELEESCYVIKIPRIKKRQLRARDDFLEEYIDPEFAVHIIRLIEANRNILTEVEISTGKVEIEKPLFIKLNRNKAAVVAGLIEDSYNMTSKNISDLLRSFVNRHKIISPITGEILHLSTRRLRYTLATSLAADGVSKRELARILDHTNTQHVLVYFELAGNIVEHLDKAMAKGFAKYLNYFKGNIIDNDYEAINSDRDDKKVSFIDEDNPTTQEEIGVCGKDSICHLDPPFSCYLCPKFQPYRHADHEYVLECMLASREDRMKKYESSRLGIQLDHVIMAVADVNERCKQGASNA
jgi:hypothetical protein